MLKASGKMLAIQPDKLINYSIIIIVYSLIISWGIDFLTREVFRLALI
jgi:hypothetical protein